MKKTIDRIMLVLAAALVISACGGGGGGGGGPTPNPQPEGSTQITSPTVPPIVAFTQSVPSQDHTGPYDEIFPGQANIWTLDQDFTLIDGFDMQFNYALWPTISSGGSSTTFPSDQVYSELTYYTPTMGAAEGVKVAAVSDGATVLASLPSPTAVRSMITGTAAFLNATSDSRLQQVLDLTSLPTGTQSYLKWHDAVSLDIDVFAGVNPTYSVVLRPLNGSPYSAPTQTLYGPVSVSNTGGQPNYNHTANVTAYAGQKVILSFEVHGSNLPGGQSYAIVDNVSIQDFSNNVRQGFVTNGDFENGLTGWTTNTPAEVQNVTSGPRANLQGLTVTRSFYTVPNKLWGRWVDVFSNPTGSAITRTVTYETSLGSGGYGIIYDPVSYSTTTTTPPPQALTSWDTSYTNPAFGDGTRDIGLVFGRASSVNFISDDGTGAVGSDLIEVSYVITVPAGGKVALVNFVLMDGTDTGHQTTLDITAKATEIDTEAKNILTKFWTDPQYLEGMTGEQIGIIMNFPN